MVPAKPAGWPTISSLASRKSTSWPLPTAPTSATTAPPLRSIVPPVPLTSADDTANVPPLATAIVPWLTMVPGPATVSTSPPPTVITPWLTKVSRLPL